MTQKKFRAIFMGSPEFALPSLKTLINHPSLDIVAVFSQPDRPSGRKMLLQPTAVKKWSIENKIPVFTPDKVNTDEFRTLTRELRPDVGIVVAFGQILGLKFLEIFPHGCVNVHGSLLPRWRGAAPIQRALMAGDEKSGVSLQKIVKQLDAGDVIAEKSISIDRSWDATQLHDHLAVLGSEVLSENIAAFLLGTASLQPQDESGVTYAHKIEKSEAHIDFKRSSIEIENKIRGLSMGPQPYARIISPQLPHILNKSVKVFGVAENKVDRPAAAKAGEIFLIESDALYVSCGVGSLKVFAVQLESKQKTMVSEFLKGHELRIGDYFE